MMTACSPPTDPGRVVSPDLDLDLLPRYEPVLRFTEGEYFFPTDAEDYVHSCELLERRAGSRQPVPVAASGTLSLERLAEIGAKRSEPGLYLRFVAEPFTHRQVIRWRHRSDRPRFRSTSRLARVGILSRIVDALMRLSLLFRGRVASGTQAAAETIYRERLQPGHHPYYARVVRRNGYVALQYWYFYAFNDWRSRVQGVNDHEADWEQVVVYLAEQTDGTARPAWVVFSAHDETGDDLRRRWDDPDLTLIGDHPVVNAGLGSHSGAYLPGDYLTTFEPAAFQRLIRAFRAISRTFLPWTRSGEQAGIGIPYVDYHQGDGLSIGPGQEREWTPVVIDDETPWVFHYRGLWGNDTADPFGGERGPAGPRYERSGQVRQSWGDVVGWSGLAKVAPNADVAADLVRSRLAEIDAETDVLAVELDARAAHLRADVASGVQVTREQEDERDTLAASRTALVDERRRLESRLDAPPPDAGPHDHLRHRALPSSTDTTSRQRVLSIWSAVSTPIILVAIAAALFPGGSAPLQGLLFLTVVVLIFLEAVARRSLLHLVATLVAIAAIVALVAALAALVVNFGWQRTLAATTLVLAGLLLIANLSELTRD